MSETWTCLTRAHPERYRFSTRVQFGLIGVNMMKPGTQMFWLGLFLKGTQFRKLGTQTEFGLPTSPDFYADFKFQARARTEPDNIT